MIYLKKLNKVKYKILVREGDTNFVASSYAQYKWLPKEFFSTVPFYVYGDKMAVILFEVEPTILVFEYTLISEAYRKQFEAMWEISNDPAKPKK